MRNIDEAKLEASVKEIIKCMQAKQSNKDNSAFEDYLPANESYKYDVFEKGNKVLDYASWTENMIGSGKIYDKVLQSFNSKVCDNLLSYFTSTFENKANNDMNKAEQIIYDIFRGDNDEKAFDAFCSYFGKRYNQISYLFFLKDKEKYMPVKPQLFTPKLEIMGFSSNCMNECNWDNYQEFNDDIVRVRDYLNEAYNLNLTLLDAHSFVWGAYLLEDKDNGGKRSSNASFLRWFNPLIKALRDLGGAATPGDARRKIIDNEQLSDEEVNVTRGKNNVNKLENELAFARNYLADAGYIDKSIYGVWTLTEAGKTVEMTDELASYIFKTCRPKRINKNNNKIDAIADRDVNVVRYWLYAPGENSCMWEEFYAKGIMAIGWGEIGDLSLFESKDAMKAKMKEIYASNLSYTNSAHATWQFANEMKIGDVVFVKKGMYHIVGRGVVTSDYEYDTERNDEYGNIRKVNWTHKGEWPHPGQAVMKTLTDITSYNDYVQKLNALFEDKSTEDVEEVTKNYPEYTKANFLDEVFMLEKDYSSLAGILKAKKNVIIQGAPGVGKTFAAKRLAYSIMGVKDVERVMMVQFHQSYSYEDFIMGFRPTAAGFELKKGAFYNFCKKAEIDSDNDYFFIIDEINRGNISKIFGELFMLIENDKRGFELQLLYLDEKFAVPENIYIIGMMNTADRSLAMLDYALRRRFAFFDIKPGFETDGFRNYRMSLHNEKLDKLINCVESLNSAIAADDSLGEGFCIGHSYFCNLEVDELDDQRLYGIVEYELIPLVKEYWFDEPSKVKDWSNNLRSAIK